MYLGVSDMHNFYKYWVPYLSISIGSRKELEIKEVVLKSKTGYCMVHTIEYLQKSGVKEYFHLEIFNKWFTYVFQNGF